MLRKKSARSSARQPHLNTRSQNQQVFSYRAARSGAERQFERGSLPSKKTSKLKRRLKYLPYVLSSMAVGAALIYNLTLLPQAQIIVSGDQVTGRAEGSYQKAINATLQSSAANRTKITIDTNKLSLEIRRQFPEIESLSISLPLLRHEPIVEIRLAAPVALLSTVSTTYILDGNGRALFEKTDAKPSFDTTKLPVIQDPSGHQIRLGAVSLTSAQIAYANELAVQARSKQLAPESMTLSAGGEELHVRFVDLPYTVKFSFGANTRQSFGAFLATRERLGQEGAVPVEYIDVRIPERSYVK